MLTHRRGGKGPGAANLPPLGELLNDYYRLRGWSEEGIPTRRRLTDLGLEAVADGLGRLAPWV